jgi:hypothetical protein
MTPLLKLATQFANTLDDAQRKQICHNLSVALHNKLSEYVVSGELDGKLARRSRFGNIDGWDDEGVMVYGWVMDRVEPALEKSIIKALSELLEASPIYDAGTQETEYHTEEYLVISHYNKAGRQMDIVLMPPDDDEQVEEEGGKEMQFPSLYNKPMLN